jgi:hypothetical protein
VDASSAPPESPGCDLRVAVAARTDDPQSLVDLLRNVLRLHPVDAAVAARHAPGVLPTPVSADQSGRLVAELASLGIGAVAIEAAQLPDLAHAHHVPHARIRLEGWQLVDLYGEPAELIPWSQIGLDAIGQVPGETTARFLEQGRPSVLSAAPMPEVGQVTTPGHRSVELWLIRSEPLDAYRLIHDHFNYEDLGPSKVDSATDNFERLVHKLVGLAPAIRQSPSMRAYLKRDLSGYDFRSAAELRQHVLLHWALAVGTASTPQS